MTSHTFLSPKTPARCIFRPSTSVRHQPTGSRTSENKLPCRRRSILNRAAPTLTNGSRLSEQESLNDSLGEEFEQAYLASRLQFINKSFPYSLALDDFMNRLEIALFAFGFNGENSIACANLCRDEITGTMKNKIDHVFGHAFNINGLGGVLTSGALGMQAGLSHSPLAATCFLSGYSTDVDPPVGGISRPGRPGPSKACGALCKALADLKEEGLTENCKPAGVHEPDNPEYSILKQRLARRLQSTGSSEADIQAMDLIYLTKLAERTITADLEHLIQSTVDTKKADYAVVTGVQIHSWGEKYDDGHPNLEFVQPCTVYAVVNGQKTAISLDSIPALTPRQIRELAQARGDRPSQIDGLAKVILRNLQELGRSQNVCLHLGGAKGMAPHACNLLQPVAGAVEVIKKKRSSYFRDLLMQLKVTIPAL